MVRVNFQMPSIELSTALSRSSVCRSTSLSGKPSVRALSALPDRLQDAPSARTKPTNVFYVWYVELCRRQNSNPVSTIRPTHLKSDQILDFVADRIKIEDWGPFLNALRLDSSLHAIAVHSRMEKQKLIEEADTEEKVKRLKKWYGCICTKYVLRSLIRSLCNCLKNTSVLSYLELEGLLISGEYLQMILKGLTFNKTLKYISFKSCPIEDDGCMEICESLHSLPNIEVLNLSSCNLGPKSGEYIAKLIKYQQINRYCESWHSSLRYEEPEVNNMAGIRRITLNNNPKIGDAGTEIILNELIDDLWIRAIDMQRCSITEAVAAKIIDSLEYNKSLQVADFRHNNLDSQTIARILEILKTKQSNDSEYQWCQTTTTLGSAAQIFGSTVRVSSQASKTVSNGLNKTGLRRQMTMPFLPRKSESKAIKENINNQLIPDNSSLNKAKDQLMKVYEKLREETAKRQKAEEKCEELQKQVDQLMNLSKNQMILKEFSNMKLYINKFIKYVQQNGRGEEHTPVIDDLRNALEEVQVLAKPYENISKAMDISKNNSEIYSELTNNKVNKNRHATLNVHDLFQNITGKPEEEEDFGINLELTSLNQSSSSDSDTARSTYSESVETMKRLLEELSHEDRSSSYDDFSELSRSSEDVLVKETKRVSLKVPQRTK